MALPANARLGPYELLALLGAGGMGEVYKARDTRLARTVALKILPPQFSDDPDRRERFEREARAVAALNHPHICNLHDIGEDQSVRFLVMEYLEGQTLAERVLRGPLPAAEVLRCAIELADALDHAHRRGLVHRDLKPGNVMLTRSGAKLLDFGLSKLQGAPGLPALSTLSPAAGPLTAEGALLGTFPYMAPEQLAGHEADARSDIFAFGAIVYEIATGRRAFEGATAGTVIGALLHTDPPPLSSLQPLAPPALDRIVARCLAKDPDNRWQTVRDLLLELKWVAEYLAQPNVDHQRRTDRKPAVTAAALAVLAIAAAAYTAGYVRRAPVDEALVRVPFLPPDGLTLADVAIGGPVTISPDGQRLAFVASGSDGKLLLWVRPLDSLAAEPLHGSDGAAQPFWSPDSRYVGFFAQRKLKKISVSGGPVQTLCDAVQPRGGSWNQDGVIVFSADAGHQLYRVSDGGGVAMPVPADAINEERYGPVFLPDGRHFVYRGRPQKHGIYIATLDSPDAKLLLADYLGAAYSPGYLLGLIGPSLGSPSGTLLAHPFDTTDLEVTGPPVPVAEQVAYRVGLARGAFSLSQNGTLVYGSLESPATELIWFDRNGTPLRKVGGSVIYQSPSLSPDEKTIAVERIDPQTGSEDLWLIDRVRDVASRLTSYANSDTGPIWSPDGTRIVFASPRGTPPNLYQKAVAGTGGEDLLFKSSFNKHPEDWSRDGRFIIYATLDPKTQWDLWLLPMSATEVDRNPVALLKTPFNEIDAQISSDRRWFAYVSDESGTNEVYVQAFPDLGARQRISVQGGKAPRWRGDGTELFYVASDGTLMAVSVKPGTGFEAGTQVPLFKTRMSASDEWGFRTNYTVSRDGQRFLINTVTEEHSVPTTLILNWPAILGGP